MNRTSLVTFDRKLTPWNVALASCQWDAIVVQTYHGSSGEAELKALRRIVSSLPPESNPILYLYVAWPNKDFSTRWTATYKDETLPVNMGHDFYAWWYRAVLNAELPVKEVRIIPVAVVMAELLQQGIVTNPNDYYRDIAHATDLLRYIGCITFASCISDRDASSLTLDGIPKELRAQYDWARIAKTVGDVINTHPLHPDFLPIRIRRNDDFSITFQTLIGYVYTVEMSEDCRHWTRHITIEASGDDVTVPLPPSAIFARVVRAQD